MCIQISYFWPQTESAHLVDVINQTDFLEGLDREKKLGQPHGTALLLGSRVDPILLALSLMNYNFAKTHDPLLLITGAIICPDSRTVCNLLRSVGLQAERCFPKYHRLLSQDKWSARRLSGVLLKLLAETFVGAGEALVFGFDDTIERRWGAKIKKRGIYRGPVHSSKSHFVKCSGLR